MLLEAPLLNASGTAYAGYDGAAQHLPGIRHTYEIDIPFDLTILNNTDRIIYNPVEVLVNIGDTGTPLIFPSGYTFKTINATYPTGVEVASADSLRMYDDPRKVHVSSTLTNTDNPNTPEDERISVYYIKPGSKLKIENCVTILDATIIIEDGGLLEYDPAYVYGNYTIIDSTASPNSGIILLDEQVSVPCRQACFDAGNFDPGFSIEPRTYTWNSCNISTWFPSSTSNTVKVRGPVIVSTGADLTIDAGLRFEFAENGKFIIEPGARVQVNGSSGNEVVFTSACQGMWNGIIVEGDPAQTQGPVSGTAQGYLKLYHAVIENARTGVLAGSYDEADKEGGIIQAHEAVFRNNYRGAVLMPYRNVIPPDCEVEFNNHSYFSNCAFENTRELYDPVYKINREPVACDAQLKLLGVKNVGVWDCSFYTDATKFRPHLRGTGLYTVNSSYSLASSSLFPATTCTFTGLSEGISSSNSNSGEYIRIADCAFDNNIHAIVLQGTNFSSVDHNDINIPEAVSITDPLAGGDAIYKGFESPVGIYLLGCSGYRVFSNDLEGAGTFNAGFYNYGMVINSTTDLGSTPDGSGFGIVERNTIAKVSYGLQAELDNGDGGYNSNSPYADFSSGLMIKCNIFESTIDQAHITNVGIPGTTTWSYAPGRLRPQGTCISEETSANNLFLGTPPVYLDIALSAGDNFEYAAYDLTSDLYPQSNMSAFFIQNCGNLQQFSYEEACPSGNPPDDAAPGEGPAFERINYGLHLLDSLLDGGDTQDRLGDVNNQGLSSTDVEQALAPFYPYLSDEVLLAVIIRDPAMDESDLETILLANSPLTDTVMQVLAVTDPPYSSTFRGNVNDAQHGISPRRELFKEVSQAVFDYRVLHAGWVDKAAIDSTNLDSAIASFSLDTFPGYRYHLLPLLLENGNLAEAGTLLQAMAATGDSSDYYTLQSVHLNLRSACQGWNRLSSHNRSLLRAMAVKESGFGARGVMGLLEGKRYPRFPYPVDIPDERIYHVPLPPDELRQKTFHDFKVYPNPASDNLTIESPDLSGGHLSVINMLGICVTDINIGKDVKKINISSDSWPSGIYILRLFSQDGRVIQTEVVIQK